MEDKKNGYVFTADTQAMREKENRDRQKYMAEQKRTIKETL
jgi:hypothetical protein